MSDVNYEKLFTQGRLQVDTFDNNVHREMAVRFLRFNKVAEDHPNYAGYVQLRNKYPSITDGEIDSGVAKLNPDPNPKVEEVKETDLKIEAERIEEVKTKKLKGVKKSKKSPSKK